MSTARFVRVSLVGDRTTGSFAGEIWNTGYSLVDQDSGGVLPGAVKESLPTFEAVAEGASETSAPFHIDWAWRGTDKYTHDNQKALAAVATQFWAEIKAYAPADSRLKEIRISAFYIGTDGKLKVLNGANVFSLTTPVVGGASAANQMPAQIAITASLRSGARGAAGRGRMFLPLSAPTMTGAAGLIGSATKTAVGTAVVNLLEDTRAISPLVSIVNRVPMTYSDVDTVEVGNYFDVQRRRENAIAETYQQFVPTLT